MALGGSIQRDPRLRYMMFVDGENLTLRAQSFTDGMTLVEGSHFKRDVFCWFPNPAWGNMQSGFVTQASLEARPFRSYYYTGSSGILVGPTRTYMAG
jgi:hypothetical protein